MRQHVVASLEYGRVWPKKMDYFWYFTIFISLVCLGLFIAITIVFKELLYLCILIMPCLLLPVSVWFLIHTNKLKRLIKLWLEDAVPIETRTKTVDTYFTFRDFSKSIKIDFKFKGKRITRYSGKRDNKSSGFNSSSGYDSIFIRLADKEVTILYSEKYDQVLILDEYYSNS